MAPPITPPMTPPSTSRLDSLAEDQMHACSEDLKQFSESGPLAEKLAAAKNIVEYLANPERTDQELKDFKAPNGFTPLFFAAISCGVSEDARIDLINKLYSILEPEKFISHCTDKLDESELHFEVGSKKMPLANNDLPAHGAIFTGSLGVLKTLLGFEENATGMIGCGVNNTGNNYFNLAASQQIDILNYLCETFRGREGYEVLLNHQTDQAQTPLHQVARSGKDDKLQVFAKLLVEGASKSLAAINHDDMTPLDCLALETDAEYEKVQTAVSDCIDQMDLATDVKDAKKKEVFSTLDEAYKTYKDNKKQLSARVQGSNIHP
ncbi:hypothetical protein [uncultured Endozoicomonas sp.]|uniref:hypothetical protein n=1 Tax=uncultured Endozoicomonas sp. TaxID=432652 RepID=UPI0026290D30|nr:hypothetical protein [uncultured Endozoicomonas sp.]